MAEAVVDLSFFIEKRIKTDKNLVLKQIFNGYYDRIYKFFIYRTNDMDVSEELTAMVFEKLVVNIGKYDSKKAPFNAWIFTIARNTMYDYFKTDRSKDRSPIEDFEDKLSSGDDIEGQVTSREKKNTILELLDRLDERERNIISYKFGGGLKNTEIGEILGLSPTNVGSILHRSIKKLKKLLGDD